MRTGIIYGYTNLETGKMYIGQTIDPKRRYKQHLNAKYTNGWHIDYQKNPDKYEYSIIEYDIPEDKLAEREIFWISFFDSYHNGYNLTPGGSVSSGFKDKHHSYKSKQKMSEARKDDKNPFYGKCGENHPNFGKHFYTDGDKNIVAYECPEGFRPGKTIFKNKKCT